MPILNISTAKIRDAEKFKQYVSEAGELLKEAGIEVVARGDFSESLKGEPVPNHVMAMFRYPDMETLNNFYNSDAYVELVLLRDEACDMTIRIYTE